MAVVNDYTAILSSSISAAPGKAAFYTFSFATTPPAYLSVMYDAEELASFRPLSDTEKVAARAALNAWASISGLTLFEVTQGVGDMNFGVYDLAALGNPNAGGFAYFGTADDRYGVESDIFLSSGSASNAHLLLHEIGHALGLKHPFQGSVTLDPTLDNFAHTVMSYTSGGTEGSVLGSFDVTAIQYLYGTNSNDGAAAPTWNWDASSETLTQTGSSAAESILGVATRDVIQGGAGDDTIVGGSGGDSIDGGDGNDTISAVAAPGYGGTSLVGGAGDDQIRFMVDVANPAFTIAGGTGTDSLNISYGNYLVPIDVNLSGNGTDGGLVTGFESVFVNGTALGDHIVGSSNGESLAGNGGADVLLGMGGNDTIFQRITAAASPMVVDGGEGNDSVNVELADATLGYFSSATLIGGAGNDSLFISYFGAQAASFSLGASITAGTSVSDFEYIGIYGSTSDDRLTGSSLAESLLGNGGNDILVGGLGADTLTGGAGADRFVYGALADSLLASPDAINDFQSGSDVLDIAAFALWDVQVNKSGNVWLVTGNAPSGAFKITSLGAITLADIARQSTGNYKLGTGSDETLTGSALNDYLDGAGGNDTLQGFAGPDIFLGGAGNDRIEGGLGSDLAVYAIARGTANVTRDALNHSLVIEGGAEGADTIQGVEQIRFSDGLFSFNFAAPSAGVLVADFAVGAGGWTSQELFPRHVADINGDGYGDLVGFGASGVRVAYGAASGSFSSATQVVANFGQNAGWSSDNNFHRELADVNGDGRADIIGFGVAGTLVSLAKSDGTYDSPGIGVTNFGANQGWTSQNGFARTVGDVNGDGKADIVGFGTYGTLVALGNGNGTFGAAKSALANFGVNQGWSSDNSFHRVVGDVNGDGKADIIGFGTFGTYVALSNGDGTFGSASLALVDFGVNQGWSSNDGYARTVADINHDGLADIVGFGQAGTLVAYGNGNGGFTQAGFDVANFARAQGWTSDATFHRELADINHDGRPDIVGFGYSGVLAALNQGDYFL